MESNGKVTILCVCGGGDPVQSGGHYRISTVNYVACLSPKINIIELFIILCISP